MEITKEILESILDAYSYEIVFVDRQHIVRYMNKTAKERYPSLEVITIFFRTTFKPFLSICRFYRLFLYF